MGTTLAATGGSHRELLRSLATQAELLYLPNRDRIEQQAKSHLDRQFAESEGRRASRLSAPDDPDECDDTTGTAPGDAVGEASVVLLSLIVVCGRLHVDCYESWMPPLPADEGDNSQPQAPPVQLQLDYDMPLAIWLDRFRAAMDVWPSTDLPYHDADPAMPVQVAEWAVEVFRQDVNAASELIATPSEIDSNNIDSAVGRNEDERDEEPQVASHVQPEHDEPSLPYPEIYAVLTAPQKLLFACLWRRFGVGISKRSLLETGCCRGGVEATDDALYKLVRRSNEILRTSNPRMRIEVVRGFGYKLVHIDRSGS